MNQGYLQGLHTHLGVTDDYNTWISAVKDNDDYLKGLHGHLGVKDNYDLWKTAIFGTKKEEIKKEEPKKEEVKKEQEKPYTFKFAIEETEDETKPTSVLVPEGETDDTEQSESTRLMANYKLEDENNEDFYNRITPVDDLEMVYSPMEKGMVPRQKTTIDGITKMRGSYTSQSGKPASQEEILRFEELTTLNNIHNEALKLKSNLAANYEVSDSELLENFDKDKFEESKKGKIKKGVVDDNLDFNFESYLNWKTRQQQDGFANYLAKTNAPLTAEHQKEYNTLAESKLPAIQKNVLANYQSEIDNKQKNIVAKYQKQADNATSQEEVDLINKKLKEELDVAMEPIYDKVNKDINTELKNDKDINALDEKYQTKYESLQEKQWEGYVENWRPKSKHFSEEELSGIGKELDKNGFAHANGPEKKAMLHRMLSNLVGMQGDIPDSHVQEIKNEYWTHFYDKLAFTPTEDGQVYSQFVLKDIATGALKSAQDKLKEEAKKYKPKVIQRAFRKDVRTPEQQALADNKHLAMTIDYSQQVLDNPESASDIGVINFFRGLTSLQGHKYVPVLGGVVDLNKSFNLYNLAKKENRTKEEDQALQLYAIKNASDKHVKELSTGYNAGAIAGESLSFMGEIILTSPLYHGVKKSVQVGIKKALDKQIKKRVKKEIGKKVTGGLRFKKGTSEMLFVPKNTTYKVIDKVGDAVGFIAATGAQTSTMPQRYLTGTFENMTPEIAFAYTDQANDLLDHIELTALVGSKDDPQLKGGDDFGKAFAKAFGTTWSEYATERMGELLPGLGKSALAKVGITESPEWIKRMSLGLYLRKMGLNKAEAFDHFAKNQAGWNGVLGEMSEEFINIPLSNLINGNDLTEGFEEQSIKEMGISIGATSLAFGGGSVLYNNTMNKTNPSYFVDGQRHADEKSAMAHLNKLKKEGRLNEDTDIEIRNDYIAFDNTSKFLEDNGLSNEMIKTGGTDISEGHIVAAEVEIMDEVDDQERERLDEIDKQVSDKEQELDTLNEFKRTKKSKREEEQNLTEIDRVTKEIEALKSESDAIKAPVKEKIIKRKKTEAYVKGLANLKSIMEEEGIDPEVLQEAKNLEEARQMLTDKLLEQSDLRQEGDKYFDTKTGDEVELTPSDKKLLKDQVEEGITSHGAFTVDPKTGKRTIIINREAALKGGGANVAGHEFLHYFLAETVNKHPELKLALGQALSTYIYNIDPRQIRDTDFRKRVETYQQTPPSRGGGSIVAMDETLTILADAMANGTYQYNETAMTKIGDIIRRIMSSFGVVVEFDEGRDVFNFIKDYNRAFAKGKLSEGLRKTMAEGAVITGQVKEFATDYKSKLDEFNKKINPEGLPDQNLTLEDLDGMGMLFSKDQRDEFSEQAESAKKILIPYGEDMENFDPNSNIITKQLPGMIKAQAAKFMAAGVKIDLPELIQDVQVNMLLKGDRNFDGRGDLYGHLNGRIKFRILDAFNNNPLVVEDFSQTQLDEARAQLDKEALDNLDDVETTESETPRTKVNVLKFQKVDNKVDNIRKIVKVKKGDTFKEITDKHAGKVGEEIFDVPETKITDPKKNLTYAKKIVNGIPEPSEAGNIQDFYRVGNNMEKLIKILPKYNVSSKDADINEVGENIQVSKETLGRGIGLKNRVLKYFYEPVIGQNGKQKRSSGKTSQVPLWRLKQEFVNPTSKIIEKTKQDLGITPAGQLNKYDRTIGQFLKGLAFFQGQQTSLSMAQRILYPEAIKGTKEEQLAKKRQIAGVTAAMSKLAFSKDAVRIKDLALNTDKLKWNGKKIILAGRAVHYLETIKDGVVKGEIITRKHLDEYYDEKNKITWEEFYMNELLDFFKSYPQYHNVLASALTGGVKNAAFFTKSYFKRTIKKFAKKNGKQDIMKLISKTKQVGPKRLYYHEKSKWKGLKSLDLSKDNGKLEFLINFYSDISKHVAKEGKGKEIFQEVLTHFGIDQSNFMRHSGVLIAHPVDKDGNEVTNELGVEEHAVQMEMARIMMGMAFDGNMKDANKILKAVYSQISLRHAEDPSGEYRQSMGEDFYNKVVPRILDGSLDFLPDGYASIYRLMKAGVDPFGYKLINEKQTIAEYFGVNNLSVEEARQAIIDVFEGKQDIKTLRAQSGIKYSKNINANKTLSKAANKAVLLSFSKESKGITILDFDDTLATTKSLVKFTRPDGTKGVLNAEEYASQYQDLLEQGYKFDFTEFDKVVKAKLAPLFNKALKLQKKFGPENMFILTARPPAAQKAIRDFLKANGLNIPLKNISALGNSTAEAKALWVAEKVGEGYNDFYFADDALQNVQAVKNMLDQFDVKSKVQQAKLEKHGKFLIDTSTKEGQKLINQIKNIPTVSSSEFKKVGKWNIDTKTKEGRDIVKQLDETPTISSSEFKKVGHWIIDLTTPEGKKIQQELRNIKTVSSNIKFSKDASSDFNEMLERTKGLPADYKISRAKARQRGKKRGRFKFWIPPSADDFAGLMMMFQGKGKQGIEDAAWIKENLLDPFARADRDLNSARQMTAMEFKALRKQFPKVSKKLRKIIPTGDYNHGDAIRVYLWDKAGMEIPGLSNKDKQNMLDLVNGDPDLRAFADVLGQISRKEEGYITPDEYWMTKDIVADLTEDGVIGDGRKVHFAEWQENVDIIFSPENLNKIEFIYGSNFREALEDILYRMKNGSNRPTGQNRIVNNFINWLNGGISVVMNWNSRSAVLQTLSTVNFINWGDNNVAAAAKAFANQKQFWKDFAHIFNSDMLRQRRAGLKTTIESNELMSEVEGAVNPARAAIRYLLRVGFTPTKIADSFAIAMGGSTFYRNRINTYLKQGMTQKEAESKAWLDFQELAEETQQSSRPDRISMQQASVLGRFILAFQNTPMQYNRISKKEVLDLVNGRYVGFTGPNSFSSKVGKILYYTAIQNLIFYSMQTALFAMMFSDDEDDEEFFKKKKHRVADNMADGILRGLGVHGAIIATVKNIILKRAAGDKDSILVEALKVSPPLSIKARQLLSADRTLRWDKDIMKEMETFDIDNPMWNAMFNVVEFATNAPLSRMESKYKNVRESLNQEHEAWQRVLFLGGWAPWNLGIENKQIEEIKEEVKTQKTYERKKKQKIKKVEKQAEEQAKVNKQVANEKKLQEKGLLVDPKCMFISTKGNRCEISVSNAGDLCTIHEAVPQRVDGKEFQCKKVKDDGKKCKMKTSNKSGYCYYHD